MTGAPISPGQLVQAVGIVAAVGVSLVMALLIWASLYVGRERGGDDGDG